MLPSAYGSCGTWPEKDMPRSSLPPGDDELGLDEAIGT